MSEWQKDTTVPNEMVRGLTKHLVARFKAYIFVFLKLQRLKSCK
jgi:hypothetical protein